MNYEQELARAVEFHGHVCPGLALGVRVALLARQKLLIGRSVDEETVAIVENDSCAVDAVQVLTGCTFGKGNLEFRDFGKQAYTFIKRPSGEALRIAVLWVSPPESREDKALWKRYREGDRLPEVVERIHELKEKKIEAILHARDEELFLIHQFTAPVPRGARLFPSVICSSCGEKVMEPKVRIKEGQIFCIPCYGPDKDVSG